MANPNRKMATLRTIDALTPIADANRIELAHIGGWNVVVGKGEYAPGDTIVYFEIDTFFPEGDKRYAFLTNRGVKTMIVDNQDGTTTELHGYVLKTAKLRKQVSQGLVMSPKECGIDDIARYGDVSKHPDVSAECGVREYVAPMPVGSYGIVGKFDDRIANRTDAKRIQNLSEKAWQAMKQVPFHATVKVDGTSTTLCYDVDGTPHVFGHNYELDIEDGMMGAEILAAYEMSGIAQWCREHPNCAVQGEFVGPKLNGNRLNLTTPAASLHSPYGHTIPRVAGDARLTPATSASHRGLPSLSSLRRTVLTENRSHRSIGSTRQPTSSSSSAGPHGGTSRRVGSTKASCFITMTMGATPP